MVSLGQQFANNFFGYEVSEKDTGIIPCIFASAEMFSLEVQAAEELI